MAVLDADRRRTGTAWPIPSLRAWRPAKSDGCARAVFILWWQRHAVPYPRHQPARIYRPSHLIGLHPYDQRGRHRSLQSRQTRHDCRSPAAKSLGIRRNQRVGVSAAFVRFIYCPKGGEPRGGNGKRAPYPREGARLFHYTGLCRYLSAASLVPPVEQVIDPNRDCLHVMMEKGENVAAKDGPSHRKGTVV